MNQYKKVNPETLDLNPFKSLDRDWVIISAGGKKHRNAMTASWGGFGVLWSKPVATVYLRPQRYTRGYLEKKNRFSISFMPQDKFYREAMAYIGKVSGRDEDKMTKAGLDFEMAEKTPFVKDAELVLSCRLLYRSQIEKGKFLEKDLAKSNYPNKDYHYVYIAEIEAAYLKCSGEDGETEKDKTPADTPQDESKEKQEA